MSSISMALTLENISTSYIVSSSFSGVHILVLHPLKPEGIFNALLKTRVLRAYELQEGVVGCNKLNTEIT